MIQVRDILQVKFGKIDQAVELFTHPQAPSLLYMAPQYHFSVLTDISGPMYTLINEFAVPSIAEFEELNRRSFTQKGFEDWFKQFQQYIEGGRREFFNVEQEYAAWDRPGMIVVRESYRAFKWQIRNAVSLLQRYGGLLADRGVGQRPRILTDASGPMFTAIIEIETESMSAWETQRRSVYRQTEFQVWFTQMLTAVETGSHEFYRVEYTSAQANRKE